MHRLLNLVLLCLVLAPAATAQNNVPPPACPTIEARREFDFWIGEWEVRLADGTLAGSSHVESILGACVLLENWSGAGGSSGKSFNYFDPEGSEWRQLWVDALGGHMDYHGSFMRGAMRFEGGNVRPDGTTSLMRMSFTPLDDGRVRQFIEESKDDGATWATWFDGYYSRTAD